MIKDRIFLLPLMVILSATNIESSRNKMDTKILPSGVKYRVLKKPDKDMETVKFGERAEVHYTGWLEKNGEPDLTKKFDSSVDRNQPFQFNVGLGQVIKGWDEGVMGMQVGEKRQLIIPSALGYGARGAGAAIPPNANLVFDVQLLRIIKR